MHRTIALLVLVILLLALALLVGPCVLTATPPSPETGADDTAGPVDPDGGSSG